MKKSALWAVAAGLVALLLVPVLSELATPREPSYKGRSFTSWFDEWCASHYVPTNAAADAIRAMGTNSLPLLMKWISKDRSPFEKKVFYGASRFIPDKFNPIQRDGWRELNAAQAINFLGADAMPAFPMLTNLMTKRTHCISAGIALAGIGSNGIIVLTQALASRDWMIRQGAALGLEEAKSDFDIVVPALITAAKAGGTTKADHMARVLACSALANLHKRPDLVVPFFTGLLTNGDSDSRASSAVWLGDFGPDAKAALPTLRNALRDSDPDVRKFAANALKEIESTSN